MPQPLYKASPGSQLIFGPTMLESRTHLASMIGQGISVWAYTETNWGNILAAIMHVDSSAAMRMYAAVEGFHNQRQMVRAVARSNLSGSDLEAFEDTFDAVNQSAKQRHRFAHWIWGVSENLPNDLLLMEPKEYWRLHGAMYDFERDNDVDSPSFVSNFPTFDRKKILVYTEKDITGVVRDMHTAYSLTKVLRDLLSTEPGQRHDHIYRRLYAFDRIRAAACKRLRHTAALEGFTALPEPRQASDVY